MNEITGGCLCGKVRFTATSAPVFQGVCHCRDCQRHGGSAFNVIAAFPAGDVAIRGEMSSYGTIGDSGHAVVRRFCPTCGSNLLSEPAMLPGMLVLRAGTFDDTSILAPTMHLYCDSRMPWVAIPEGVTAFPKAPD